MERTRDSVRRRWRLPPYLAQCHRQTSVISRLAGRPMISHGTSVSSALSGVNVG